MSPELLPPATKPQIVMMVATSMKSADMKKPSAHTAIVMSVKAAGRIR